MYLKLVSLGLYVTTIARTDMSFRQCKLESNDTIISKVSMMIIYWCCLQIRQWITLVASL